MVTRNAVHRPVPPGELPDFEPVPRRNPRHDGWTPERQRAFVESLADCGCAAIAARMVNMSRESVYQLRRAPGAASFRRAMDAAQGSAPRLAQLDRRRLQSSFPPAGGKDRGRGGTVLRSCRGQAAL